MTKVKVESITICELIFQRRGFGLPRLPFLHLIKQDSSGRFQKRGHQDFSLDYEITYFGFGQCNGDNAVQHMKNGKNEYKYMQLVNSRLRYQRYLSLETKVKSNQSLKAYLSIYLYK